MGKVSPLLRTGCCQAKANSASEHHTQGRVDQGNTGSKSGSSTHMCPSCLFVMIICYACLTLPLSCSADVTVAYGVLQTLHYVDSPPIPSGVFEGTTITTCAQSCSSRGTSCRGFSRAPSSNGVCTLFTAGPPGALPTTAAIDLLPPDRSDSGVQAVNGIATLPQTSVTAITSVANGPFTPEECKANCLANTGVPAGGTCFFAVLGPINPGTCTLYTSTTLVSAQPLQGYTTFIKANLNA